MNLNSNKVPRMVAALVLFIASPLLAQNYTEVSELGLIGKMMPTSNPYHRIDTCAYPVPDRTENAQVRQSTGMMVVFSTNSRSIKVRYRIAQSIDWGGAAPRATRGFDIYFKEGDSWGYAGGGNLTVGTYEGVTPLCENLDGTWHDCLVYLPISAELDNCQIVTEPGSQIRTMENPFRHRILFYGSSYTHGVGVTRAGMTYPSQFGRHTGFEVISLAMNGRCRMQSYITKALCDAEADAFVFDTFSNSSGTLIRERLFPFIEEMKAAHPGVPLIFQQSIFCRKAKFNSATYKYKEGSMGAASELMHEAVRRYSDVYFIVPTHEEPGVETTTDGSHPDNYGYTIWSRSIEGPILDILSSYGIE